MTLRPGTRLGVDVGAVRVGVARSDPDGLLATPVVTLLRDEDGATDLAELVRLAQECGASEIVVGLPMSLSGTEGLAARRARDYASHVHRLLPSTPVRMVDERLTTVDAHRALRDSGVPGRRQRARIDQAAAVLILQAALDTERTTGRPAGNVVGGRRPRARRPGARHEGTS